MKFLRYVKRDQFNVIDLGTAILSANIFPENALAALAVWCTSSFILNVIVAVTIRSKNEA